jgi:hypothetical protein
MFYARLLRWRPELIETRFGFHLALDFGGGFAGVLNLTYRRVDR